MIGQQFGNRTVIAKIKNPKSKGYVYLCRCICGDESVVHKHNLLNGSSQRCKNCRLKEFSRDYSGQKFNQWTVLNKTDKPKITGTSYIARCDCGTIKEVAIHDLLNGKSKRCLHCYDRNGEHNSCYRHGLHNIKEYRVWTGMRQRCSNPKSKCYRWYGGRGIKVCERWADSFQNFYQDMGARPTDKHEIDRINTNGNYEPSNCRWITHKENLDNMRNPIYIDEMPGKRFGKYLVIEHVPDYKKGDRFYKCICDCGAVAIKKSSELRHGRAKQCRQCFFKSKKGKTWKWKKK